MIISDSEKFVFVHNPKCGGMTWHSQLKHFDTRDNFFFEWKKVEGTERTLDMAHITPFQLRRFYPTVFEEVSGYLKFGFVRNPYQRFCSAVSQHLKLGSNFTRTSIMQDLDAFYSVASAFSKVVLKDNFVDNDHRLVHFKKQLAFHNIDGARWTDECFKIEDVGKVYETKVKDYLTDLEEEKNKTGGQFDSGYDISLLSENAISLINKFYERDFEIFEYDMM